MKIKNISAMQILDSRANPTLMVQMQSEDGKKASFCVPSGASKGASEALELRDKTERFNGMGVQKAVDLINDNLAKQLLGTDIGYQKLFDEALINLDGTAQKSQLGGNTILGLSGAYLHLSAYDTNMPLFAYVQKLTSSVMKWPRLFANIVNGGKHAPGLGVQEFMIVPETSLPTQAIEQVINFFSVLQQELVRLYGATSLLSGDEGGMAPQGATTDQIISMMFNLNSSIKSDLNISLDVAATSLYEDDQYKFEGKNYSAEDFANYLLALAQKYNIYSIEDPLLETDVPGFSELKNKIGATKIIGDDISVTNAETIRQLAVQKAIDGVIIKPNQIGTFSETFDAIKAARENNLMVIISHRSGETVDDTIIDLACGVGADGVKLGAPRHGERIAKYNRLLQIEEISR